MSGNSWRDMQFDALAERAEPRGLGLRVLLRWAAALVTVASLALYLLSRDRAVFRCHQECYGAAPRYGYGSLTYEPGHAWTHYAGSWQWSVQHGLTQFAVLAAVLGLGLAFTHRRNPLPALAASVVALAGWAVWTVLSPAVP